MARAHMINPIPDFDTNGNLPPGVYKVTLENIEEKLTWSAKRKILFQGLKDAIENLQNAGISRIYINGSFTSNKDEPNDVDGCWEVPLNINKTVLDPVFLDRDPPREKMKTKYGVDFLIAGVDSGAVPSQPILELFLTDRNNHAKGLLVIET